MRLTRVTSTTAEEFVAYALAHGAEHDESWANPDDLARFDPAIEPAFLLHAEDGEVAGAASLMVRGYAENGAARFRILHAQLGVEAEYAALVEACIAAVPAEVGRVFLFLPDGSPVGDALARNGFEVERRAYLFRRPVAAGAPLAPEPPNGVTIAPIEPATQTADWVRVTNAAFGGQPGRFDATAETLAEFLSASGSIDGGFVMASHDGTAIGLARVTRGDEPDEGDVEQVAVVPAWQGRGVGRALLRTVLGIGWSHGLTDLWLSTGETNARAIALYTSEGFGLEDARVCWQRAVPAP